MKPTWNSKARERFAILRKIYDLYRQYNSLNDVRQISITPFESQYAEYLVAQKLVKEDFIIDDMFGRNYDIKCANKKIEVKSGRLQRHVKGIKHDFWSWVVKEKQWKSTDHFDYLVCVALGYYNDKDGILVFSYENVIEDFTRCSWTYKQFNTRVKDYLRLNLVKDGLDAFFENTDKMRVLCDFEGEPTEFEIQLNTSPDEAFKSFSWERFIEKLKAPGDFTLTP